MLTFNLKKEWFEKIKSGEKTHEYRLFADYWKKRLTEYEFEYNCRLGYKPENHKALKENDIIYFACGYPRKEDKAKWLKARVKDVTIKNGLNTDLKIDKDVFDIEFELIKD